MLKLSLISVLVAVVCQISCDEISYTPDIYPGKCPSIPPSQNFKENQLLHVWRGTHYVNTVFFNGTKCLTIGYRRIPTGLEVDIKMMFNNSEINTTTSEMPTKVPGVYDFSMTDTEDESHVVTGVEVYFIHKDHQLLWGCVQIDEENHDEFVLILSLTGRTPAAVVDLFKQHLNNHGSNVKKFYAFPEARCEN